jgi:hypothetical protein
LYEKTLLNTIKPFSGFAEHSSPEDSSLDKFPSNILLAKNTPSEESSGRRTLRRGIFRPNFPAKKYPAKNFPSEKSSGEESSGRRMLQRRIFRPRGIFFRAKNSPAKIHPCKELSGEESSVEEFS